MDDVFVLIYREKGRWQPRGRAQLVSVVCKLVTSEARFDFRIERKY